MIFTISFDDSEKGFHPHYEKDVNKMRKSLLAAIAVILLLLTACIDAAETTEPQAAPQIDVEESESQPGPQPETPEPEPEPEQQPTQAHNHHPLIFNSPEVTGGLQISPAPWSDFHLPLTPEQLAAVFPLFDMPLTARAYYWADGTLTEVWAAFAEDEMHFRYAIKLGVGRPPAEFSRYTFGTPPIDSDSERNPFGDDLDFQTSYVHEVSVTALMVYGWERWFFQAEFALGDIYFRVGFHDDKESGKALLTEIVNNLILGGTNGLSALDNPDIPYLRSEALTLAEARLDGDFGAFVPANIPARFGNSFIFRTVREHEGENRMFMSWEASPDYDYLYEIYTHWVAARSSDAAPWAFDRIFWGNNHLTWTVSTAMPHDFERLVSVDARERYDWALYPTRERYPGDIWGTHDIPGEYWSTVWDPVFLAEEMSLDAVRARVQDRTVAAQGAWGDDEEYMYNVHMAIPRREVIFGVLFGDVLVSVRAEGMSAEEVSGMFAELLQ